MKINTISSSWLHKLEYADYVKGVIKIVNKHDPELLKIGGVYNRLLELQPQLEGLTLSYGKHPVSKDIRGLRKVRETFITAIQSQIISVETANLKEHESELRLMLPTLHRFFDDIKPKNEKDKSERIDQFLRVISSNETMNDALKTLGFDLLVAKLLENSSAINELIHLRNEDISVRPKMQTEARKKQLAKAIYLLFHAIELARLENSDLNFQPLIDELNVWNTTYQTLAKSRRTQSAKKSEMNANGINKTVALSDKTTATV